jgi:hypothetical protein
MEIIVKTTGALLVAVGLGPSPASAHAAEKILGK